MPVVVPFLLPKINNNVIPRVISMYNPIPVFQAYFYGGNPFFVSPSSVTRNELSPSFGFPNTKVSDYNNGVNIYAIPPNAYTVVNPSQGGFPAGLDTTNSLLLIDMSVSPIEPGISRLVVDYIDVNSVPQTAYYDVPFWEDWDVHPSEIQQIIDYMEQAIKFIQDWINRTHNLIVFESAHIWPKGLSVSGDITVTQATANLTPTLVPHSMPLQMLNPKRMSEWKDFPAVIPVIPLASTFSEGITSTLSTIYPGQTITLMASGNVSPNDVITFLGTPVPTTYDATTKTYTAISPPNLPYTVTIPVWLSNNGVQKTPKLSITFKAKPRIKSMTGPSNMVYGFAGDPFTIIGSDFGTTQGSVTFTPALSSSIISWSDNLIVGTIPTNASPGYVSLQTAAGYKTQVSFNINNPVLDAEFEITPNLAVTTIGETIQFESLYNSSSVKSSWSIISSDRNLNNGNATYGTIDQTGLYTAPSVATNPLTVSIVSNYKGPFGSHVAQSSVVILPGSNTLTISPSATSVLPSFNVRFEVFNGVTQVPNSQIQWLVNGVQRGSTEFGFIDFTGIYSAPNVIPSVGTVYVTGLVTISGTTTAVHAAVRIGN